MLRSLIPQLLTIGNNEGADAIPIALYLPKNRELEAKVKDYPKTRTEAKLKAYSMKIREHFFAFFMNDLLDYKNWNYNNNELFLNHQRKKKLSKDHYEFIKRFADTNTFKIFQMRIQKWNTPQDRKFNYVIEEFMKNKFKLRDDLEEDIRQYINVDESITRLNFNYLQEKYNMESNYLPIRQIMTAQREVETAFYRYLYFPKMLQSISANYTILAGLHWPTETLKSSKIGFLRDIFNPEQWFTHENIKDAIWLTCWIGTYWYHEEAEKRIHLMQLLLELPKMKLTIKQKDLIVSQIIDNVEIFGKPVVIAENLSYLLHCLKTIPNYVVDWRHQNQLYLCFNKLSLGVSLSIDSQKLLSELEQESLDDPSNFSSASLIPAIILHKATEIEKRKLPLERIRSSNAKKFATMASEYPLDMMSMTLNKADSVISRREAINKNHKFSSKSITRREVADKDKSVYKRVMLQNSLNKDEDASDVISLHKRTLKYDMKDPDYEYKIRPVVYWYICKKNLPVSFIEDNIPKDNEKVRLREKVNKESDNLSVCTQWGSWRVKSTLLITRWKALISKYKKKYEKFLEIDYFGPFLLFSKLKKFQKLEYNKAASLTKQNISSTSLRYSGILQEVNSSNWSYRLLQFDIKEMFLDHKELYWNLIYRFTKDKKDYVFMLPYEVDMEEEPSEFESSSMTSDEITPVRWKPEDPVNQKESSSFFKLSKHEFKLDFHKKDKNSIPRNVPLTSRDGADNDNSPVEENRFAKSKLVKMKSRDSRKSF
jgi:hypothetical protein